MSEMSTTAVSQLASLCVNVQEHYYRLLNDLNKHYGFYLTVWDLLCIGIYRDSYWFKANVISRVLFVLMYIPVHII